jgi:predicted amidohydrolase
LIVDPQGEILADAGERQGCISAELDLANLRKYREGLPFLADLAGADRGRGEDCLAPPSKLDGRISRIQLSSQ